jgi:hypothetical protein
MIPVFADQIGENLACDQRLQVQTRCRRLVAEQFALIEITDVRHEPVLKPK